MANLPLQDGYETQLAQSWNGATGTIYVLETPVYTPKTTPTIITVNPGKTNAQLAVISDYDASAKTLTVSAVTGLEKALGVSSTTQSHGTGSKVIISDNYEFWKDLLNTTDNQTITGDLTFDGDATFNGVMNFSNIGDVNVNGKSNPAPVVADTTARDALYPSPVTGDMVYVTALNAMQVYNTATAQWESLEVGTPAPTATTSVQGIMKIHAASADPKAIVSEEAGTSGTAVSASNKLVDSADTRLIAPNIDTTYPAGETLSAGNVVFIENAPTTAQATSAQNIGDVAANTRVSFPVFGSGVAGTTTKLNLAKVGSPSVAVQVRIETDNAGSPSGTLVNANATGTVAAASIQNSSMTLGDADATDTDTINTIATNSGSYGDATGYLIYSKYEQLLTTVTKHPSCTATKCRLMTSGGVSIVDVNFVGNTATFTTSNKLDAGTQYYVSAWNSGPNFAIIYDASSTFPSNGTNINIVGGSASGPFGNVAYNILSISTATLKTTVTLGGSFTIPAGQKCHTVISQVSDTVNASNYYKVGYYTNDTTTRFGKYWNGSTWGLVGTPIPQPTNDTLISGGSTAQAGGYRFTALLKGRISSVTRAASSTPTRAVLLSDAGAILGTTTTLVGDEFTFSSPIDVVAGTTYRIELDSNGGTYARYYDATPALPTGTYMQYLGGSLNLGTNDGYGYNVSSVGFLTANFPYTSSTLFNPYVLSKTDADYTYKIDWHGITQEAVTAGDLTTGKFPKVAIEGVDSNQTSLTPPAPGKTTYYIGNTPGAISSSAGTNSKKIGAAISATKLQLYPIPL